MGRGCVRKVRPWSCLCLPPGSMSPGCGARAGVPAGMTSEAAEDMVLALNEVATNAVLGVGDAAQRSLGV
jgi:hypothetical protein